MVADALSRKWKVAIRELGEWNKKNFDGVKEH